MGAQLNRRNLEGHGKISQYPDMATRRIKMLFNDFLSNNTDIKWKKPKGHLLQSKGLESLLEMPAELSLVYLEKLSDVYYAEGLALNEALVLAEKLKLKHVFFETDSKDIVLSINCKLDQNIWRTSWYLN
ncbi:hypothetical protein QQ045_019902 [Rhodiola kirilowii]